MRAEHLLQEAECPFEEGSVRPQSLGQRDGVDREHAPVVSALVRNGCCESCARYASRRGFLDALRDDGGTMTSAIQRIVVFVFRGLRVYASLAEQRARGEGHVMVNMGY